MNVATYDLNSQSPELTEFYSSVWRYLEGGHEPPNGRFLKNQFSLCGMMLSYLGGSAGLGHPIEGNSIYFEMKRQFRGAGLCINYPFNHSNHQHFWDEKQRRATWQNPERLAWLSDHLRGL